MTSTLEAVLPMKALTIWQPWASMIAMGHKKIETRSWSTRHRGLLAIHAASRAPREEDCRELVGAVVRAHPGDLGRMPGRSDWPRGVVVAICHLDGVRPTEDLVDEVDGLERRMGNYGAGRFAWMLEAVRPIADPPAVKGFQGLWDWSVSGADLLRFSGLVERFPVGRRARFERQDDGYGDHSGLPPRGVIEIIGHAVSGFGIPYVSGVFVDGADGPDPIEHGFGNPDELDLIGLEA